MPVYQVINDSTYFAYLLVKLVTDDDILYCIIKIIESTVFV